MLGIAASLKRMYLFVGMSAPQSASHNYNSRDPSLSVDRYENVWLLVYVLENPESTQLDGYFDVDLVASRAIEKLSL